MAIAIYGDRSSAKNVAAYEKDVPKGEIAGLVDDGVPAGVFDRVVTAYAYQWGFLFIDKEGRGSRNAMIARPGERILFHLLANDVIHGFNVPAARFITEVDPAAVRTVWIRAPRTPGKYLIQCVDYCGVGHHQMKAWLVVKGEAHADATPHG